MKIVGSFSDLLDEEVFLVNLECGEDLVSSEVISADCFPNCTMLEEFSGLEGLEVFSDDDVDRGLSDFFGLLSLESFILLDERLESAVTDDVIDEEVPDCVLIVHIVPLLVGVTFILYHGMFKFA